MKFPLSRYHGFIFDLDGTLYRGDNMIPGAAETINKLRNMSKRLVFISNKTTGSSKEYITFLREHGCFIEDDELFNATNITAAYLKLHYPDSTFFAIGEAPFITEIEQEGLSFSRDPQKVDIVLITLDRSLTYEKLEIAAKSLENGARFFAANIDNTCPVEGGEILDAGSTISALEKRTGRKLELYFGKPSQFMIEAALDYLKTPKDKLLLIGDRAETDIAMGQRSGIDTALVATGVKNFDMNDTRIFPTYYLTSVTDLLK